VELEVGQLVKAAISGRMHMGMQGTLKRGDAGLITKVCKESGIVPGLYQVYWLSGTASGDWWMDEAHVQPIKEDDNEV
jgi:hypothetical protein